MRDVLCSFADGIAAFGEVGGTLRAGGCCEVLRLVAVVVVGPDGGLEGSFDCVVLGEGR